MSLLDANGAPVSAGSTVTAVVTGSDRVSFAFGTGTAITGSPFTAVEAPVGTYTITIASTSLTTFDIYDVVWTWTGGNRRETQFEVVGSFLFSLPALRAMDPALADTTAYPPATINKLRGEIEDEFEVWCAQSFIRRGARLWLNGTGDTVIRVPLYPVDSVISASIRPYVGQPFVALDAGQIASIAVGKDGRIERTDGGYWGYVYRGAQTVQMLVRYGWEQTPEDIRQAGLLYAKARLLGTKLRSDLDRAARWSTSELAIERAERKPTGFPDVDGALDQYRIPVLL